MNRKYFLILAFFVVYTSGASAHQNNIMDINLRFDPIMEAGVVRAAQDYFNTQQEPAIFDLLQSRILVSFDDSRKKYVLINPDTFEIMGFNDMSLRNDGGEIAFSQKKRYDKAKQLFDSFQQKYKSELDYAGEKLIFNNVYRHQWYRKVKGVLVLGEEFFADVDAVNGNIVLWQLSHFEYPIIEIDTKPGISKETAAQLAQMEFKNNLSDKMTPKLVVIDDTPMWVLMLYNRISKDYYVILDANTGDVKKTGHNIGGTIPEGYTVGNVSSLKSNLLGIIVPVLVAIAVVYMIVVRKKKAKVRSIVVKKKK